MPAWPGTPRGARPGATVGAHRGRSLRLAGIALLVIAIAMVAWLRSAGTGRRPRPVAPATAVSFGSGLAGASQTNALHGTLAVSAAQELAGTRSAMATYDGSGVNGYARTVFNVDWRDGEEVSYGAAFYLPPGFHAAMLGQVALLRWDDFPARPDAPEQGGVVIDLSNRRAYLERDHLVGGRWSQTALVGPFDLPEGRWFTLAVHQHLSAGGHAHSDVVLDGRSVGSSGAPTAFGDPIQRVRYGLVAIAAGAQRRPLALWFDRTTASPGAVG